VCIVEVNKKANVQRTSRVVNFDLYSELMSSSKATVEKTYTTMGKTLHCDQKSNDPEEKMFFEGLQHQHYIERNEYLKEDDNVKKAITKFWVVLDKNVHHAVDKQDILTLFLRMCRILNPDLVYSEAMKVVEEDWIRDSLNDEDLSYEEFFSSIFEIVDIWCPQKNASAYAQFLDQVSYCLSYLSSMDDNIIQ